MDTPHNELREDPKETLLEFPCSFAVKAMGRAHADFETLVIGLVRPHIPDLCEGSIKCRPSKAGNFTAVTITFTAQSKAQIDQVYHALTGHPDVLMAL